MRKTETVVLLPCVRPWTLPALWPCPFGKSPEVGITPTATNTRASATAAITHSAARNSPSEASCIPTALLRRRGVATSRRRQISDQHDRAAKRGPARDSPHGPLPRCYERERARLIARSSCAFVIVERPWMPSRFAWLYSCSFVRLVSPLDELEERRRLDEVEPVERDRVVPDLDRLPLARLDDPLLPVRRLPDFAVEPVRFFVPDDRLRPELLERAALRPPCRERPLPPRSFWSSPSPISFLATPTAAGTATPSAAPATTFLLVDMPSLSLCSIATFLS